MRGSAPRVLQADDAGLTEAAELLAAGSIVAAPTDTVYGIAAALDRPDALSQLFVAKGRPEAKAIPLLLADATSASRFTGDTEVMEVLASAFWPGALTIVVRARPGLPAEVVTSDAGTGDTVALRVPASPIMQDLCRRAGGALAVTSANASGSPPATRAEQVLEANLERLAAVINDGPTPGALPSTIVSVTQQACRVIREGAIPADVVHSVWERAIAGAELRGMISR